MAGELDAVVASIFCLDGSDVRLFESASDVRKYIEPIDIEQCRFFDEGGTPLAVTNVAERAYSFARQSGPDVGQGRMAFEGALRSYLLQLPQLSIELRGQTELGDLAALVGVFRAAHRG